MPVARFTSVIGGALSAVLAVSGSTATLVAEASPATAVTARRDISAAASAGKPSIIITKKSTTSPTVGAPISISGRTTGGLAGRQIQLQIKSGSKWLLKARTSIAKNGTFTLKARADATGQRSYRTYIPKSGKKAAVSGNSITFRTYYWVNLYNINYVNEGGSWRWEDPANIATVTYRHNLLMGSTYYAQGETHFVEWSPQGFCRAFRATAGAWADSQSTPGSGTYRVTVDGEVRFEQTRVFNDPAINVSTSLSGSTRLQLAFDTLGEPNYRGLFGAPQVLCWKNPSPVN